MSSKFQNIAQFQTSKGTLRDSLQLNFCLHLRSHHFSMKAIILLATLGLLPIFPALGQISIKQYKQADEQTFYINTDTSSEKFNAKTIKKAIKTSPEVKYTWYKSNQLFTIQGGYDGRILNGEYTSYYKNSGLKAKGCYSAGVKTGIWYSWYPDGNLKEVSHWKKGLKSGITDIYENGKKIATYSYKHDLLHGKSIRYNISGASIIYYANGVQDTSRQLNTKKEKPQQIQKANANNGNKQKPSQPNTPLNRTLPKTPKHKNKHAKEKNKSSK